MFTRNNIRHFDYGKKVVFGFIPAGNAATLLALVEETLKKIALAAEKWTTGKSRHESPDRNILKYVFQDKRAAFKIGPDWSFRQTRITKGGQKQ